MESRNPGQGHHPNKPEQPKLSRQTTFYCKMEKAIIPARKYRHEYKFIINAKQKALLKGRLKNLISPDPHAGPEGSYWIRSVYFDDYDDSAFFKNEAGVNERTKYRIRIYNASDSVIKLECKSKKNGMTNKESAPLTREMADRLIAGCTLTGNETDGNPLLSRFDVLMKTRLLRARCIIEYQRDPYICKEGNVRITLDDNISSSLSVSRFFDKDTMRYLIMPKGQSLLEVKYDDFLPSYIKDNLELGRLSQTSFSKYYLGRRYSLPGKGGRLK